MAESTRVVNVYLDEAMNLYLDPNRSQSFSGTLYQSASYPNCYFLDEALTVKVCVYAPPKEPAPVPEEPLPVQQEQVVRERQEQLPAHDVFSREHTLFLIELMREHLTANEAELPKSLSELNSRVRLGRGKKKIFWQEMASKLTSQFQQVFDQEKVARKWYTLEDAYKRIKDNNNSTGKGPMKFQFFKEIDALLGDQHDIEFPVVGTAAGVHVRRPEALQKDNEIPAVSGVLESTRKRKGKPEEDPLLEWLKEYEEASQRRHDQLLEQMVSSQKSFEGIMKAFIDKQ